MDRNPLEATVTVSNQQYSHWAHNLLGVLCVLYFSQGHAGHEDWRDEITVTERGEWATSLSVREALSNVWSVAHSSLTLAPPATFPYAAILSKRNMHTHPFIFYAKCLIHTDDCLIQVVTWAKCVGLMHLELWLFTWLDTGGLGESCVSYCREFGRMGVVLP